MKRVNLDKAVKKIEVFYDGRCAMCRTFIGWLVKQERACELVCLDYASDEALGVFPEIRDYDPDREIVVRMDLREVYVGGEGWVCCLWGCSKYRDLAEKMNSRVLLPVAKKVCYLVSKNRFVMSKLFFGKKNEEIAAELEQEEREKNDEIECEGGCG